MSTKPLRVINLSALNFKGKEDLTPREFSVLELLISGYDNKNTAIELGISPRTIEVHRTRAYDKLGQPGNLAAVMCHVLAETLEKAGALPPASETGAAAPAPAGQKTDQASALSRAA